jgi:hypothetical protein
MHHSKSHNFFIAESLNGCQGSSGSRRGGRQCLGRRLRWLGAGEEQLGKTSSAKRGPHRASADSTQVEQGSLQGGRGPMGPHLQNERQVSLPGLSGKF